MMTLQGMRMKTEYMTEQIRQSAISETLENFKTADRRYYETSEGGAEVTKLIHQLESLGVNPEYITDLDLSIRDEVFGL